LEHAKLKYILATMKSHLSTRRVKRKRLEFTNRVLTRKHK